MSRIKQEGKSIFRGKKIDKKKGIIFSLDSLIALLITGVIISSSFFYLSQVQSVSWSQPGMQVLNYDSLNILHVDKTFENSIKNNDYTKVGSFFNDVYPEYICANITFYDAASVQQKSIQKTGCIFPENKSDSLFVARRVFIYNHKIYYVHLQTWYS